MAEKPLRPCKRTGCLALTRTGYCDKHMPDWRDKERTTSQAWHWLYNTKAWRNLREPQLLQEPFCRECARHGIRVRAEDVDHITPHKGSKVVFLDKSNLQSLCHRCHSRKTMRERMGIQEKRPYPPTPKMF